MPTILSLETSDKHKPTILIFPDKNPLSDILISYYEGDFKIIEVTNKEGDEKKSDYFRISPESSHLIKNLDEVIDYAVIFLGEAGGKQNVIDIVEKLTIDKTKTVFVVGIEQIEVFYDLIIELKNNKSFSFLIQGDIFSIEKNSFSNSNLSKIIQTALTNQSILIIDDNLESIFPIHFKDAVNGINQVLFSKSLQERAYYLFYNHPQTLLSVAHLLKRVEPELELKFSDLKTKTKKEKQKIPRPSLRQIDKNLKSKLLLNFSYLDSYLTGFEKSLQNSDIKNIEPIQETQHNNIFFLSKFTKKILKPNLKYYLKPFFFGLGLYILILIISGSFSLWYLKTTSVSFERGDLLSAGKSAQKASSFLNILEPNVKLISSVWHMAVTDDFDNKFQTINNILEIANRTSASFSKTLEKPDFENLNFLLAELNYAYFEVGKLKITRLTNVLQNIDLSTASRILSAAQVAPDFLDLKHDKNYLVLFQNNNELRPNGGFIGSIADVTTDQKGISNFSIMDVYQPDGQLKAHIEPPYVIRRFLQPHFYLRDSNFYPDFPTSATFSALLYNLETEKKIEGVIAIDFEVVKKIVENLGPIKLSSKTVDSKNLNDFLQETIERDFFPGSSQKKDLLNELYNKILLKLQDNKNVMKIVPSIMELIDTKHILFSFQNTNIESIFISNKLSGSMRDLRESSDEKINDYLSISEANIGVNKANKEINRVLKYEVDVNGQTINSKVIIEISNSNHDLDYKTYLRIFTPLFSKLQSITINGVSQKITPAITDFKKYEAANFKSPSGLEVDELIENGKQSFGFITNVQNEGKQIIELSYKNGLTIPNKQSVFYSLLFIKQPGTDNLPINISFSFSQDFSLQKAQKGELKNNTIAITEEIKKDQQYLISLSKKE
ncbi:MAG: hypothetical protein COU27_02540 [Candidatus Levybacteria bacterium CG10_big_fil_rev_8_21_14_0_10_36_7]|nr:MAG: hypothetical protein COU27_02540 [Candidatus Levybacteria bacterium CG10_big_fil_rev_8_21_14_0_10_36_7]